MQLKAVDNDVESGALVKAPYDVFMSKYELAKSNEATCMDYPQNCIASVGVFDHILVEACITINMIELYKSFAPLPVRILDKPKKAPW